MGAVTSTLQPLSVNLPPLVLGQTVLVAGIVTGLNSSVYSVPYLIKNMESAATVFGSSNRFIRAIGEVIRQGAPSVLAIAISDGSDLGNLFKYINSIPFDILVPVNFGPTNIQSFANFAYLREQSGNPIMIVMSYNATGLTQYQLQISPPGLLAAKIPTSSGYGPLIPSRWFVFTIDNVTINPNYPSQYTVDAAPSIAGLMARSLPHISITGQSLQGLTYGSTLYSPTVATILSSYGYTLLRQSVRNGLVPYKGVTGCSSVSSALNYSPTFWQLSTMRTCQYVEKYVQIHTDSLIGEPSNGQAETIISNALNDLVTEGVIIDYNLSVQVNQVAGAIYVTMAIKPQYETQMVTVYTQISLRFS